jgi:hypothetical protein
MQSRRSQPWPELIVGALGALPVVVTWLHVYSHTPPVHSEPTWTQTIALVAAAVAGTPTVAWLLRARLRVPWHLLAVLALTGPVLVVATGVVRTHAARAEDVSAPVVGALAAAVAWALATLALAIVPLRRHVIASVLPLALALAAGHAAYAIPTETRFDLWRSVGGPWPNAVATRLLYGHALES